MSSDLGALLISKPVMADLRERFGGFTLKAWAAVTPERGGLPDGVVRIRLRPDHDSRWGYAALSTLDRAYRSTTVFSRESRLLMRLLSFYWPLFPSHGPAFNDSGGTAEPIGPVLSPEKSRYLHDCWRSVDILAAEVLLDFSGQLTDSRFRSAKALLAYLSCYADFLQEAIARDSFYCSYDGPV